jgi:hypothetical protein
MPFSCGWQSGTVSPQGTQIFESWPLNWGLPSDVKYLFCRSIIECRDPCLLNVVLL